MLDPVIENERSFILTCGRPRESILLWRRVPLGCTFRNAASSHMGQNSWEASEVSVMITLTTLLEHFHLLDKPDTPCKHWLLLPGAGVNSLPALSQSTAHNVPGHKPGADAVSLHLYTCKLLLTWNACQIFLPESLTDSLFVLFEEVTICRPLLRKSSIFSSH